MRWLEAFSARGHEVVLLVDSSEPQGPAVRLTPPSGVRVVAFRGYGRRLRPPGALSARRSLGRALAAIEPDVVHAHAVSRYGWLARIAGRRPYVVTPWGSDLFISARKSPAHGLLARLTLAGASLVTVDSLTLAAAAVGFGARPDRVRLVAFGVDTRRFKPGPADERLRREWRAEGRRVVFSPRSLRPVYRQDVAVRALTRLPEDVILVLCGHQASPEGEATLRRLAAELGVDDRIRWLPPIDHASMPAAYRASDVVLSIPASDSIPVTLWEAMASGRPVVASDLPDARWVLESVDPTALVAVGDVSATAEALETALTRGPAAADRLADRLRAIAVAEGDQATSMDNMELLYRAVAAGAQLPGEPALRQSGR